MKDSVIEKARELEEYMDKHKIRYVTGRELKEESERRAVQPSPKK